MLERIKVYFDRSQSEHDSSSKSICVKVPAKESKVRIPRPSVSAQAALETFICTHVALYMSYNLMHVKF
jgi:hypothetical protein